VKEMSVGIKLVDIQRKLKAPKGQYNSFGKYKYRSCEDILEAVKPLLAKEGCVLVISDDVVQVGERYYIKATATLTDSEDGSCITTSAFARESFDKKGSDESQITGAASSYARKYCLNGLFLIDDTRDSDATNTQKKEAPVENEKLTNIKKQIVEKAKELGGSKNAGVKDVVAKLGNPNALKTIKAAEEYLKELNKINK
jgi:hypothetical protein